MTKKDLNRFKSMGSFLLSMTEKYLVWTLVPSSDMKIAVEIIGNGVDRTKKLTGRIFSLKEMIPMAQTKQRTDELKDSIENRIHFNPITFDCYEYEPYMFVTPIIEYLGEVDE